MSRQEKWQNYKDTVSGRNLKKATTPNVRRYRKLKDKRDDTLDLVHPGYYKAQAQYERYKRGLEGAEQEDYFMFDPRASKLYALEAKKNRLSVAHHPKYYKYDNQMHEMMKDPQAKQEVSDYKNARKKRNMARLGTGALVLGAGLGGVLAADGAYRLGKKLIAKRAEELKEEMEKSAMNLGYGFITYKETPEELKKIRDNSKDFDEFEAKIKDRGTPDYIRGRRLGKDIANDNFAYLRETTSSTENSDKLLEIMFDGVEDYGVKHSFNYDWINKRTGERQELPEYWYGGKDSTKAISGILGGYIDEIESGINASQKALNQEEFRRNLKKSEIRKIQNEIDRQKDYVSKLKFYNLFKNYKAHLNMQKLNWQKENKNKELADIDKSILPIKRSLDSYKADSKMFKDWKDVMDDSINDKDVNSYSWRTYYEE